MQSSKATLKELPAHALDDPCPLQPSAQAPNTTRNTARDP